MSGNSTFIEAVERIINRNKPMVITEGAVTKVNKDAKTCDIERDDLPEMFDVRLCVNLDPGVNVVAIFPKVGSKVLVGIVENNPTDGFVLTTNDIESIIINDGKNGGLTITPELVKQLDKLAARVDGIIDAIKKGVPGFQDGGAALQTTQVALLDLIVDKEKFDKVENELIKH